MFKKKKVEEERIAVKFGSKGCIQFVTLKTLGYMYDNLRIDRVELHEKLVELSVEVKKLKEENAKLNDKNEQIGNISLNIGTTPQEIAKQICDNLLKDKENKTLTDDLKAINKDLQGCSFVQSNDRAKYWMTKLKSLYPYNEFVIRYSKYGYTKIKVINGYEK